MAAPSTRKLGPPQPFTFGFGTIVGIAWVVLMGQLLATAGLAGALIGLTAGALMMATIGVCYAEMGMRLPVAGGEVAYVRDVFWREDRSPPRLVPAPILFARLRFRDGIGRLDSGPALAAPGEKNELVG